MKKIFVILSSITLLSVHLNSFATEQAPSRKDKQYAALMQQIPSRVDGVVTNIITSQKLNKAFVFLPSRGSYSVTNNMGYFKMNASTYDAQIKIVHPDIYDEYYNVTIHKELYTPIGAVRLQPNMIGENHQFDLSCKSNMVDDISSNILFATIDILEQAPGYDFNDLLERSASIYKFENGNSLGSSSLSFRGSDDNSNQVNFNGISLINPETGAMNTALYMGMSSWARKLKVTQGMASSSISEIGTSGTIDVLPFMPKQNASAESAFSYGEGSSMKASVTLHTGTLMDNNFAMSVKYDRNWSDGIADVTGFSSNGLLLNAYMKNHQHHQFNLVSVFKDWTSQQRPLAVTNDLGNSFGAKFNNSWGYYNDEPLNLYNYSGLSSLTSFSHNYFIDRQTRIVSQVYAQFENSNSTRPTGHNELIHINEIHRDSVGLVNFETINAYNSTSEFIDFNNGFAVIGFNERSQRFGIQSQYLHELDKDTKIRLSVDLEHYKNHHFGLMNHLLGAKNYYDDISQTYVSTSYNIETVGKTNQQIINHNYKSFINRAGLTGKAEKNINQYSLYSELAAFFKTVQKEDLFSNNRSELISQLGGRLNIGGLWRINQSQEVKLLINGASIPKHFNLVFSAYQSTEANKLNNQHSLGSELAYNFRNGNFLFELRGYATQLYNTSYTQNYFLDDENSNNYGLVSGANRLHMGVEINNHILYGRHRLYLSGQYSQWRYNSNAKADIFSKTTNERVDLVELEYNNVHVGNSSPMSLYIRNELNILGGLEFNVNYYHSFMSYAPMLIDNIRLRGEQEELESYGRLGLGFNYLMDLYRKGSSLQLFFRVDNLLNTQYFNKVSHSSIHHVKDPYDYPAHQELYPNYSSNSNNMVEYGRTQTWRVGFSYIF